MPTYKAKCQSCGEEIEYQAKITERDFLIPNCPECGKPMVRVFINNVNGCGFILKGDHWYKKGNGY